MDLDRLRQQDGDAFAQLVAEHQTVVMGLGQSLGLRGADLDDAAAEAFAAVFRALPRFQGRSELGTWIYSIAYRVIVKARSRRNRQKLDTLASDLPSESSGPVQDAQASELAEVIWKADEELEPRQASVVEFYYRRQWPLEKIASVLQCPVGTVKTLLFRAREQLRQTLAELEN